MSARTAADVIETPRLRGRRPDHGDAGLYAELFGAPEVALTLWPPPFGGPRTPRQAASMLGADIAHWRRFGFGAWLFFEPDTGLMVGRGGLRHVDVAGKRGVEVLYAIAAGLSGRGYATEIASAVIGCAGRLGLDEVIGFTLTTNHASQRVLEKAGLVFAEEVEHAGYPHWFGRLDLRPSRRRR